MPEPRRFGGATFPEQTAPSTPASGGVSLYAKSDGRLYQKDDAGAELVVGGGVGFISHGSTAGTARPTGYDMVIWRGTVEPTNLLDNVDLWVDVS